MLGWSPRFLSIETVRRGRSDQAPQVAGLPRKQIGAAEALVKALELLIGQLNVDQRIAASIPIRGSRDGRAAGRDPGDEGDDEDHDEASHGSFLLIGGGAPGLGTLQLPAGAPPGWWQEPLQAFPGAFTLRLKIRAGHHLKRQSVPDRSDWDPPPILDHRPSSSRMITAAATTATTTARVQ